MNSEQLRLKSKNSSVIARNDNTHAAATILYSFIVLFSEIRLQSKVCCVETKDDQTLPNSYIQDHSQKDNDC